MGKERSHTDTDTLSDELKCFLEAHLLPDITQTNGDGESSFRHARGRGLLCGELVITSVLQIARCVCVHAPDCVVSVLL